MKLMVRQEHTGELPGKNEQDQEICIYALETLTNFEHLHATLKRAEEDLRGNFIITFLFLTVVVGTAIIVALTYLPAIALGPLVEHLFMIGK